jgi:hypothetical protein
MKKITETEHLAVFESDELVISEYWCAPRRLYVGFPLRDLLTNPVPAVTALVTFTSGAKDPADRSWMFFEWLETSVEADAYGLADELRQEFMDALRRHLPELDDPEPETIWDANGVAHYLDSADALANERI